VGTVKSKGCRSGVRHRRPITFNVNERFPEPRCHCRGPRMSAYVDRGRCLGGDSRPELRPLLTFRPASTGLSFWDASSVRRPLPVRLGNSWRLALSHGGERLERRLPALRGGPGLCVLRLHVVPAAHRHPQKGRNALAVSDDLSRRIDAAKCFLRSRRSRPVLNPVPPFETLAHHCPSLAGRKERNGRIKCHLDRHRTSIGEIDPNEIRCQFTKADDVLWVNRGTLTALLFGHDAISCQSGLPLSAKAVRKIGATRTRVTPSNFQLRHYPLFGLGHPRVPVSRLPEL